MTDARERIRLRDETQQVLIKAAAALSEPTNPPEPIIAWTALALHNLSKLYPDRCESTCDYVRSLQVPWSEP